MAIRNLCVILVIISLSAYSSLSQAPPPPPNSTCNDVFVSYTYNRGRSIPPFDPTNQAYRFESTVTVLNNGRDELKSWRVYVGFQYKERLTSATNAVLADGTPLPGFVGNGTEFVGFPATDLKTAIDTAGDLTQMEVRVELVGTQFGVGDPGIPLPNNLTLVNDGYTCPAATTQGNEMHVCCIRNVSSRPDNNLEDNFLPRQDGDVIIMYDVTRTYENYYWAQVNISNHNPLGRLDNWKLSWEWMSEEFIYAMKGAYPSVVDIRDCIYGRQGQYYSKTDFSQALSCEKLPTIIDLPPTSENDTNLGLFPLCCRNGTILSPTMDPSKSFSVFEMQVFKMPPYLNRSSLIPPQNWKINGTFNSDFECGPPIPVSPSHLSDPNGLPSKRSAVASWQVVCNITHFKDQSPKCCVSFSAFYNDSVVPCSTCACGCNTNPSQTCSANETALLLPYSTLLLPFENRTREALEWARIKRMTVPNPLPCGDGCGVSINWHVLSDYRGGWNARISLFNWDDNAFADWFAAVQLDKAAPGFEKFYSFNGSALPESNNTLFMQGFKNLNYLLAERDGDNPRKDPRVPGMQQSVISFTKKKTPGINVAGEDGFPTKVIFNGEECALPAIRPSSGHKTNAAPFAFVIVLALLFIH
ncbi:hypothetical protein Peur_059288 [Populus x canadensis]|uniref:COBRA C-terminal domain-containing protein n=1 Tax=Populus deltoides TaxID=3696 RepID=A0A8T2X9R1_POPDE|nr:hypothetical protein H0E87_024676 [Populus deltoides]